MTDAMPNILDKTPRCTALLLSGAEKPIIVAPPEKIADAPTPATARPTMRPTELWAVAQTMDPTAFISMVVEHMFNHDSCLTLENCHRGEINHFHVEHGVQFSELHHISSVR